MNPLRCSALPVTPAGREAATSSSRDLQMTLITLHFPAATGLVYQSLTTIRKDCSEIGQKSISAYLAQPKPALIGISCNVR
jgi:hypothetical protein